MNLLLDTRVLLWWLDGSRRLGRGARARIAARDSAVWISAATAWEVAIKAALGRLTMKEPPEICLPREIGRSDFHPLAVGFDHALAVRTLPPHHADPFDRLLIAQARTGNLTIVTADAVFRRYDVRVLDASE